MSEEKKAPIPVGPGEKATPIRLGHTNMASLIGTQQAPLPSAKLSTVISASGHDAYFTRAGVLTGAAADAALAAHEARMRAEREANLAKQAKPTVAASDFHRGQTVFDTVKQRKATIVKLHAATTKGGYAAHKLVAKNGDSWLQSERKLKST